MKVKELTRRRREALSAGVGQMMLRLSLLVCIASTSSCVTVGSALANRGKAPIQKLGGGSIPANKCASPVAVIADSVITLGFVAAGLALLATGYETDVPSSGKILGTSTLVFAALPYGVGTALGAGLTLNCHRQYTRRLKASPTFEPSE